MTQRYDTYKESGVQWLGEIPGHWETTTLRKFLRMFSVKNHGDKQLLSVTREQGVIVRNIESKEENHNFIPGDLSGYKYVQVGDFVINKMKSWQGSYGVSKYEGIVSPAYYTCKLEDVDRTYFSMAIRNKIYVSFFGSYSKGIRVDQWDLSPVALKSIPFALPPLPEQRAIVTYLDDKCEKIDKLVEGKQKQIELLAEMKQRIIADAVTRGLNPNVTMKATNIPWLEEIPEHWEMKRAKYLLKLLTESTQRTRKIGLENIESNTGKYILTESIFDGDGVDFDCGDILYGKLRPYLNKVWLAEFDGNAVGDFYVYRAINGYLNSFAKYLLMSSCFVGISNASTYGAKMPRVSSHFIHSLHFPVPPILEQRAIVTYLDDKCSKIDLLVEKLKAEIDTIKEYKQRLISDVVTGQIKVC